MLLVLMKPTPGEYRPDNPCGCAHAIHPLFARVLANSPLYKVSQLAVAQHLANISLALIDIRVERTGINKIES